MWSTLWLFVLGSVSEQCSGAVAEGAVCAALPESNWKPVGGNSCDAGSGGARVLLCVSATSTAISKTESE